MEKKVMFKISTKGSFVSTPCELKGLREEFDRPTLTGATLKRASFKTHFFNVEDKKCQQSHNKVPDLEYKHWVPNCCQLPCSAAQSGLFSQKKNPISKASVLLKYVS